MMSSIRPHSAFFCLAVLLVFLGEQALAETFTMTLQSKAQVAGREVQLQDVALFDDAAKEIPQALKSANLGLAPNPGYTRYIDRGRIMASLEKLGFDRDQVKLTGAEGVLVTVKSTVIGGDELNQLGMAFIKSQLAHLDGTRIIENERRPADLLVPKGKGLISFDVKWHGGMKSAGMAILDIQVFVDGEIFTTLPVNYTIRCFRNVLIAQEDIPRGVPFTPDNTAIARAEVTRVKGRIAATLQEMNFLLAGKAIRAGQVIRMEDGFSPDLVLRGRMVNVKVTKGRLLVRARGVARDNGALHEMVTIQNPESGRTYKAMVIGPNQVEVRL